MKQYLAVLLLLLVNMDVRAGWKAGAAKIIITPPRLMWMSGYGSRDKPAEGKLTDLWAKALILEDGQGRRAALVTLDLVGIDRKLAQRVCVDLKNKFGLDRPRIILSTSHTHTGPVVGENLKAMYSLDAAEQRHVDEYTGFLHARIIQVVGDASQKLGPAHLTWNTGSAGFAVNRRNNVEADVPRLRAAHQLKGPVDDDVPVLAVRDHKGRLQAIVFGYACHATVLSFYRWSGDYPGFAQIELEKSHRGAIAMFWAGCGADQNPLPRRTVALAQKYGSELARAVDAVLDGPMQSVGDNLNASYSEIDLPFADLPTREQIVRDAGSKNRFIASRARLLLATMQKQGSLRDTYPYPVQVWRLGKDLNWIVLGGEVVVDYALRLKKEIAPGKTWVMSYANDVMAYIPSLRVLKEGGYEGGGAMLYYGLPTAWGPRVEELIVAAVKKQRDAAR
jgi:neutral ceramidase